MKKIFALLALASVSMGSFAQDVVPEEKYSIATNSFGSNWFVQAGLDWNAWYSAEERGHDLSKSPFKKFRSNPGISLAFGKWFTPGIGLRTKIQGFWGKKVDADWNEDTNEADDATIQSVGNALSGTAGVSRVQYMSKEDVLNQYKGYMSDYAALLNEFENDNPFKANYRVTLSDLTQMESMSVKMQAIPGVVSVTAPVEMTNIFVEIQKAVTKGGRMIVLVLMVVSIITVGSTIRLSVFARRREIEIMKYVGATNRMVTLPFFVEGLTMGLISGILTAAVSLGCYTYVVNAAGGLGGIWQMLVGHSLVPVANVLPTIVVTSLISGAVVGGVGSMFSIRKHLNV